eukprot:gnl/Trimastix_PCT/4756.p2 GENE.gnl/Trimastix_PCT/4756~~gnl/Trimastix_PCT/4756.p2  ORF type:complete len:180 (+),score=23.31 gnl/Trimastix_PCT/4756:44-541(+)
MKGIVISTQLGQICIRFREDVAPHHCQVIESLVQSGMYNGCTIYRAEPSFVVQAGLRLPNGSTRESPHGGIPLEYNLPNKRGTCTMARWDDPSSATSEFFINLSDNTHLDRSGNSGWALGFTVWGEVVCGLEVADAISRQPTHTEGGLRLLDRPLVMQIAMCSDA